MAWGTLRKHVTKPSEQVAAPPNSLAETWCEANEECLKRPSLEGVDALKVGGLVDGDVAVHRHADDDVHRRRHEGVEHGDLEVRLEM